MAATPSKNSNGNKVINGVEILGEEGQSVEAIAAADRDLARIVKEEEFMNEMVTIEISASTDENANPIATVSVNGVNQPIPRGMPVRVKRKYVEVLARCKETKYTQRTPNPMEPDKIEMVPRTAFSYPFQVVEDENKLGAHWLRSVMAEA